MANDQCLLYPLHPPITRLRLNSVLRSIDISVFVANKFTGTLRVALSDFHSVLKLFADTSNPVAYWKRLEDESMDAYWSVEDCDADQLIDEEGRLFDVDALSWVEE